MPTTNEYLSLITSEFRGKSKFEATVALDVAMQVRVKKVLNSLIDKFDIGVAEGEQLDFLGQWVGVSRNITIPITGIYFSWDDDYTVGWDFGIWQSQLSPTSITVLPDDVYRTLIKSRIASNRWDGTTESAYIIWDTIFTNITILIQDYQNMSYSLIFVDGVVDSLTIALIQNGYIPLKPEGVELISFYIPIDEDPIFGWDIENQYFGSWDIGSWAREILTN